jgi:hypothetical protein
VSPHLTAIGRRLGGQQILGHLKAMLRLMEAADALDADADVKRLSDEALKSERQHLSGLM